jgi:mRNA-degrading endonuclease RelE of RelBE toxin-antitoxin system
MTEVVLTPAVLEEIAALPTPIANRMGRLVERLRHWPDVSGAKPLKGDLAGKYRLRTGDYRLQFRVECIRKISKVKKTVKGRSVTEEKETIQVKIVVEKGDTATVFTRSKGRWRPRQRLGGRVRL